MQVKMNEIYSEAIGELKRVNEVFELTEVEGYQYSRKADKFL